MFLIRRDYAKHLSFTCAVKRVKPKHVAGAFDAGIYRNTVMLKKDPEITILTEFI